MTLFDFAKKNILRDKNKYIYYFINCTFSVFIFFLFSMLSFHPAMSIIDKQSTMGLILALGEIIAVLFTLTFISYSVSCFLKSRSKQFGVITILGASKKQLNKLIFFENMIVGWFSILCGITLGMVFSKLFLTVANRVIGVDDFTFYFPVKALILTILVLGFIFFCIAYFTPKAIRKEKIIKLIKAEISGEKKEKLFVFITVDISLIPLVSWSFISKSELAMFLQNSTLFLLVIFITILITTYLIFAIYMRVKINLAKKSCNYYKKTNMLSLSNMKSVMRSNTQSLTLTAILYAISFFSLIIMFSMSNNVLQETEKITPYAFTYYSFDETKPVEEDLNYIESSLQKLNGYKKIQFKLYRAMEGEFRTTIISESEYNRILAFIGRYSIEIADDEVYLVSGNAGKFVNDIPQEINNLFEELGVDPIINGKTDKPIVLSGYTKSVSVVSDKTFNLINGKLESTDIYAYDFDNWQENKNVSEEIEKHFEEAFNRRELSVASAYCYLKNSQLQNNLTLYIGGILCFAFILAVASLIYSRLYSNIEKECEKYRGIVKTGLSKRELAVILDSNVRLVLILPFIVAVIYLWCGVFFAERYAVISNVKTSMYCTVILFVLQLIYYEVIQRVYRNTIFERVFIEV